MRILLKRRMRTMTSFLRNDVWKRGFRYSVVCFVFALGIILARPSLFAASPPNIITYQGKLLENSISVTTTKAMEFVIFDAESGGTAVYTAAGTLPATSPINITPQSGTFSVDLGGAGTNPLNPSLFANNNLYLEVTIGGVTLSPRKRISAVPYAINSALLNGHVATSTPQSEAYIPVADTTGAFTFNTTTVSDLFSTTLEVSGVATFLLDIFVGGDGYFTGALHADGVSSTAFTLNGDTITSWPIGGSSTSFWASSTGVIYPADLSDIVLIGTNSTSSVHSIFEVDGVSVLGETYVQGLTLGRGSGDISSNTVFGHEAFASNTTGIMNVAIGKDALRSNTTGWYNTAVGGGALYSNTLGNHNVAIGLYALFDNVQGAENTAIGSMALANSLSSRNTAVGRYSMQTNTSGFDNTAVGYQSLTLNQSGDKNTAFGFKSLSSITTGNYNTAIGNSSGVGMYTGSYNTVIGAGDDFVFLGINSGSNNTIIGARVTGLTSTLSNNIILADGEGNQRIRVLDTGFVGINTTTPTSMLTVDGSGYITGTVTSSEFVSTGGITLGGVRRTTWPTGGGDSLFVDGGGFLSPVTNTHALVLGTSVWDTTHLLQVQGNAYVANTTTFGGTIQSSDGVFRLIQVEPNNDEFTTTTQILYLGTELSLQDAPMLGGSKPAWIFVGGDIANNQESGIGLVDDDELVFKVSMETATTSLLDIGNANGVTGHIRIFGLDGSDTVFLTGNGSDVSARFRRSVSVGTMGGNSFGGFVYGDDDLFVQHDIGLLGSVYAAVNVSSTAFTLNGVTITTWPSGGSGDSLFVDGGGFLYPTSSYRVAIGTSTSQSETLFVQGDATFTATSTFLGNTVFGTTSIYSFHPNFSVTGDDAYFADDVGVNGELFVQHGVTIGTSSLYLNGDTTGGLIRMTGGNLNIEGEQQLSIVGDGDLFLASTGGSVTVSGTTYVNAPWYGLGGLIVGTTTPNIFDTFAISTNDVYIHGLLAVNSDVFVRDSLTIGDGTLMLTGSTTGSVLSTAIGDITLSPTGIDTLTVTAGSIGINSSTPNYNLAVSGTANITGNTIIGGDLTVAGDTIIEGDIIGNIEIKGYSEDPQPIGSYANDSYTRGLWGMTIFDDYLYVSALMDGTNGSDDRSSIFNVSDPTNITLINSFVDGHDGIDITPNAVIYERIGDFLIGIHSASITGGFQIIDMTDPSNPQKVANVLDNGAGGLSEFGGPMGFDVEGMYMYIASMEDDRVIIFDISNPYEPIELGVVTNNDPNVELNGANWIEVRGNYAYVTSRGSSGSVSNDGDAISIIDVSDPRNPVGVSSLTANANRLFQNPTDLVVEGNYMYISSATDNSVAIVDIANPSAPTYVTHVVSAANLDNIQRMVLFGDYIYAISRETPGRLVTIDVSDVTNPAIVNVFVDTASTIMTNPQHLQEHNGYLYVGSFGTGPNVGTGGGIQVFDIASFRAGATKIGSATISKLDVRSGARFFNDISVYGGLTIGKNGLLVNGDIGFMLSEGTSATNTTNTLNFSHTALFNSTVTATESDVYIFNTRNTVGSEASLLSIQNNSTAYFDIFGNGTMLLDGNAYLGTNVATETITNGLFTMDGDDAYIHDLLGVGGSIYVEQAVHIGTSSLHLSGDVSGGLISMTNGDLQIDSSGNLQLNTINHSNVFFGNGNVGIGTTTAAYTLTVDGTMRVFGTSTLGNVLIGATSETIDNASFTLDGDDLFVAGSAGIEGILYNDGGIRIASGGPKLQIGDPGGDLFGAAKIAVEGAIFATESIVTLKGLAALTGLVVDGTIIFGESSASPFIVYNNTDIRGTTTLHDTTISATSTLDVNGQFELNLYNGVVSNEAICMDTTITLGKNIKLGNCDGAPGDVAEVYETELGVEVGHIVMATGRTITYEERLYDPITGQAILRQGIDPHKDAPQKQDQATKQTTIAVVDKATRGESAIALGVVSTNPNQTLGKGAATVAQHPRAVAIVGRVPVRVNLQQGPIVIGDAITVSDDPGVGMKAMSGDATIGIALEPYAGGGSGRIMVALMSGQYGLLERIAHLESELQTLVTSGDTSVMDMVYDQQSGTITSVTGPLSLQGYGIFGVRSISGVAGKWRISESGYFMTTIETSEGTKDFYALQSEQSEIVLSGSSQLVQGTAVVTFSHIYEEIIDPSAPIKISVTLTNEANGVYVTDKHVGGFTVRELGGGASDATFDWVAIVYRIPIGTTPTPPTSDTEQEDTAGEDGGGDVPSEIGEGGIGTDSAPEQDSGGTSTQGEDGEEDSDMTTDTSDGEHQSQTEESSNEADSDTQNNVDSSTESQPQGGETGGEQGSSDGGDDVAPPPTDDSGSEPSTPSEPSAPPSDATDTGEI